MPQEGNKDWIDHLSAAASFVGLNPVRVRWKLMRWQERWRGSREKAGLRLRQVRYAHRICHSCGSIQDGSQKICDVCGARLLPRMLETLRRCGLLCPRFVTPTSLLITVILFQYYRAAVFGGGDLFNLSSAALIHFGANFPPAVWHGDWWRTLTCIFLHAGAMHILFNLLALKQIGPVVEEIFGKGRTLFFFMTTGILASVGSALIRSGGVGIGASGAIMGLVGLTAGWGQREGGAAGRNARNSMLQWGVYTLIFGYMVGADNAAHLAGLVSGFVFGFIARPARDKRLSAHLSFIESCLGVALFVTGVAFVNFPPKSVLEVTEAKVSAVKIVACGESHDTNRGIPVQRLGTHTQTIHEGEPGFPTFTGDCKTIDAKLGGDFGIEVIVEGSPPDGIAYLTTKMIHPPIHNPESNTTQTIDEWNTMMDIGFPRYTGWEFDFPWEMVPGEWTLQIVGDDGETVLAEKTFTVRVESASPVSDPMEVLKAR